MCIRDRFPEKLIKIGNFNITPQSIGIILISLAIITGLHLFFTRVKVGKCMQLASSDAEGAAMMGVNVAYMRFLTFGISAGLAAIAGIMIAPLTYARVDMSATIGMKAFAAAILGGIGNLWGALLGGVILEMCIRDSLRPYPGCKKSAQLLHLICNGAEKGNPAGIPGHCPGIGPAR